VAAPAEPGAESLLRRAYDAFNARDIDAALALMHPAVEWPNGMEGGYVYGREAVRQYWTRQWHLIDPSVTPRAYRRESDGRVLVEVHQSIRDLEGNIISDQLVEHLFSFRDGLIVRMQIRSG
jgi:ketosteroid isomerase-like protein